LAFNFIVLPGFKRQKTFQPLFHKTSGAKFEAKRVSGAVRFTLKPKGMIITWHLT